MLLTDDELMALWSWANGSYFQMTPEEFNQCSANLTRKGLLFFSLKDMNYMVTEEGLKVLEHETNPENIDEYQQWTNKTVTYQVDQELYYLALGFVGEGGK